MFAKSRKTYEMLDGMLKPGVSSYHHGAFGSDQEEYYDPNPWPYQTVPVFHPYCTPDPKENSPNFPIVFQRKSLLSRYDGYEGLAHKECPFSYDLDDTKSDEEADEYQLVSYKGL